MTTTFDKHKQLRDRVAERLRTMIARGELHGGEWLRQERIAAELGISYTPIREALKQLEAEGLVEHVPYKGVRVVHFHVEDVLDIYTMRAMLEGLAAASAAQRLTDEQLTQLQTLHESMCRLTGPETLNEVRDLNRQFHLIIIEASGRTYLIRTLNTIWTWFPTMLWSQFAPGVSSINENAAKDTGTVKYTVEESMRQREAADNLEHAGILEALRARNSEAAERLMHAHIDHARQALIDHLGGSSVISAQS
jgi:DNA-binding GntR family transcriptional regulator